MWPFQNYDLKALSRDPYFMKIPIPGFRIYVFGRESLGFISAIADT